MSGEMFVDVDECVAAQLPLPFFMAFFEVRTRLDAIDRHLAVLDGTKLPLQPSTVTSRMTEKLEVQAQCDGATIQRSLNPNRSDDAKPPLRTCNTDSNPTIANPILAVLDDIELQLQLPTCCPLTPRMTEKSEVLVRCDGATMQGRSDSNESVDVEPPQGTCNPNSSLTVSGSNLTAFYSKKFGSGHQLTSSRAARQSLVRHVGRKHKKNSMEMASPSNPGRFRGCLQILMRHPLCDLVVSMCILANSIIIGLAAESIATNPQHEESSLFSTIGNIFSVIFISEFALRLVAEGPQDLYCGEGCGWNWFDLFVVMEAVVDILLLLFAHGADGDALSNMRSFRFLKIVKLLRVLRVARIIQFTAALRQFMQSTLVALKLLVWALVLLALVVFMFAVLFTSSVDFSDPVVGDDLRVYFGSLGDSAMTLVQCIFGGLSWREAVLPLRHSEPFFEIVFLLYFCITHLTLLNVVTGVCTTVALKTSENDPDLMAISVRQEQEDQVKLTKRLFDFLDVDGVGYVTLCDFEAAWSNGRMHGLLRSLNIDTHDYWLLFGLLDADSDGLIAFPEMLDSIMQLSGNAVQLELARLHTGQQWLISHLARSGESSAMSP